MGWAVWLCFFAVRGFAWCCPASRVWTCILAPGAWLLEAVEQWWELRGTNNAATAVS